jgi:predicted DNA-binding transcriptional regulator YafY
VILTYAGTSGEQTVRTIRPIRLLCKAGAWYVKAYCVNRQDFRIFELSRILSLVVSDETFPPMRFPEESDAGKAELSEIALRFSADAAYRVYDEFDASQVTVQEDNTLTVRAWLPEDLWLTGYLLSFGTQVEVIEPAYLKDTLAKQAYQIYQKNSGKT